MAKLSEPQIKELREELTKGPRFHGYDDDDWTIGRVRVIIARLFRRTTYESDAKAIMRSIGMAPVKKKKAGPGAQTLQ